MRDHGVSLIPTMTVFYRFATGETGLPASAVEAATRATKFQQAHVKEAWDVGANIGMGTDAGAPRVPHGTNSAELEMFTKCGLDPLHAVMACTFNSAKALGFGEEDGDSRKGEASRRLGSGWRHPERRTSRPGQEQDLCSFQRRGGVRQRASPCILMGNSSSRGYSPILRAA